ncbi:hypothetical protein B0H14DRAFT_2752268, partial [Mycena olivaceomarginata]
LVEEIIGHLADDFLALKACSLVSYLFESYLANVLTFRDLLRSPSCTFRPHVRTLHSVRYSWDPNDGHFEEIAADLRCLTNVVKLVMDAAVGDATASALIGAEFSVHPQVTHLVLDYYFMGERPVPLIDVICLFPALQHLQIFTMAGNWAVPPLGVLPPKDYTPCAAGHLPFPRSCVAACVNHLPNVDSLTLDRRLSPADVSTVRVALDRIGGALHHLDIDLGGLSEVFDFSLHRNLRTLVIHSRDLAPNQMMDLVDSLEGLPLERLTFDIVGPLIGDRWTSPSPDSHSCAATSFCGKGCLGWRDRGDCS